MNRCIVFSCALILAFSCSGTANGAVPDLSEGVQVLALLANPYGANTYLIKDQMERLGWDVTFAGTSTSVPACSRLCSTFFVDHVVEDVGSMTDYDVLVVMPTPGTFHRVRNPVGDLRESEPALDLVRDAFGLGLTLYTGCSGILLFGDAGCLDDASVLAHRNRMADCREYGADCTIGSATTPPMIAGQLVTATNQRVWPREIAAAIARSLDLASPALESAIDARPVDLVSTPIPSDSDDVATRSLGTELPDVGRDVCSVIDGHVVVGMTYSTEGREDVLVIKLSDSGELLWSYAYGGAGRDFGEGVCQAPDGGVYVAGYTTSTGNGQEDLLILRIDRVGNLLWAATAGGDGYDAGFDVCPARGGGAVVTGLTYSSGSGLSDLYVVKVTESGETAWQRTHGGSNIERGESIRQVAGGYLVAGGTSSTGAGNVDMYVVRLDETGRELWSHAYGRSAYDIAVSAIPLEDGGFLVTGHGDREGSEVMALTVVRLDANGDELWTSRFGSSRDYDYGVDAVELEDGRLLVAGVTNEPDPGENDVWLHVLDAGGNSIAEYIIGGGEAEWAGGLSLQSNGTALVVGQTASYGAGGFDVLLVDLTLP